VRLNIQDHRERRRVGVDECKGLIVGHHDVDGGAVLVGSRPRCWRTDRSAAAGLDPVARSVGRSLYVMAD
jgi:hypothetical protein